MGMRRTWTEDQLRRAVRDARSLNDVFTRLGLAVGGSQWLAVRSLILERGWSTQHWDRALSGPPRSRSRGGEFRKALDASDLRTIVARSRCRADVIRGLGFEPATHTYRALKDVLRKEHIPVDHFESNYAAMRRAIRPRYQHALDAILVRDSTYNDIATLKRRLIDGDLLVAECAVCGIHAWCGEAIVLHLDHINGIRNDHRLENLRLLCPNCHSQTQTYCGRNIGRGYSSGSGSG